MLIQHWPSNFHPAANNDSYYFLNIQQPLSQASVLIIFYASSLTLVKRIGRVRAEQQAQGLCLPSQCHSPQPGIHQAVSQQTEKQNKTKQNKRGFVAGK